MFRVYAAGIWETGKKIQNNFEKNPYQSQKWFSGFSY